MLSRRLSSAIALTLITATAALAMPAFSTLAKWPPWLSIESPVNPFDPAARAGAVMLVHAAFREGTAKLSDVTGTAEGLVAGARRSIPLRFDTTSRPGVFAVRRQWPSEGTWLLRISLQQTTAIVSIDQAGNVGAARVPTYANGDQQLPRVVTSKEIDSTLAQAAKR